MRESDDNYKVWIKYCGLALALTIASLIFRNIQKEKMDLINSDYKVGIGRISFMGESTFTMQLAPSFEYCVSNKCFKSNFSISKVCSEISTEDRQAIKSITFPVLYATSDPSEAIILVQKSDFVQYQIEYPKRDMALLSRVFECNQN